MRTCWSLRSRSAPTESVHSGDASGLVPSSFRIMRQVLDRLEDSKTGRLLPQSFHCEVPADRLAQAQATTDDAAGGADLALPQVNVVADRATALYNPQPVSYTHLTLPTICSV